MPPKSIPKYQLTAVCAPGVEPLLFDELQQLHVGNIRLETGGIAFTGTNETIARINLQSRLANRILLRLGHFHAVHLSELEKQTSTLPFDHFISSDTMVAVSAVCKKSRIYHSGAAAQRVAGVIAQAVNLNSAPTCQKAPDFTSPSTAAVQVRIVRDQVTISLDTSGLHLHKRGYRTHVSEAPLRENIAAAALRFCGYTGEIPLINPMCGSGTIAIEAALMAARIAPGMHRPFAFEQWPSFDAATLASEKTRARNFQRPPVGEIAASDILKTAIDTAVYNAEAAQILAQIQFTVCEISQLHLPKSNGLIVVNPPWGKRLGADSASGLSEKAALSHLYGKIGELHRQNPGWQICLITSDSVLARQTGIKFQKVSPVMPSSGIRIQFHLS